MLKKFVVVTATLLLTLMSTAGTASADSSLPVNLIVNGSAESATDGELDNWLTDSSCNPTSVLTHSTTSHTGAYGLTVTNDATGDASWYFAPVAVQAGQTYTYSSWYQSTADTQVDYKVTHADGTVTDHWLANAPASATWQQVTGTFTVPADAVNVSVYQILAAVGTLTIDDVSMVAEAPKQFARGLVSLTFDDSWLDQYTLARPILNSYGLDVTYYLLTQPTVDASPDHMTIEMMQTLKADGNELADHSVDHQDLTTLPSLIELENQLVGSQTQLRLWFGQDVAKNFASPFGAYNDTTINEIKKHFRSHRSTDPGYNSKDSFDVYNIKVQTIVDSTTPAEVQAWVDQAIEDNTWLVLVYHRIDAVDTAEEDYSVTSANLSAQLNYIKNSGVAVKTVDQALDEILPQLEPPVPPTAEPGQVNGNQAPAPTPTPQTTTTTTTNNPVSVASATVPEVAGEYTEHTHATNTKGDDGKNKQTDKKTPATPKDDTKKTKDNGRKSTWVVIGILAALLAGVYLYDMVNKRRADAAADAKDAGQKSAPKPTTKNKK